MWFAHELVPKRFAARGGLNMISHRITRLSLVALVVITAAFLPGSVVQAFGQLLQPVVVGGTLARPLPPIEAIQAYCKEQTALLWDEVKRLENPHKYWVDLSPKLWEMRQRLIREHTGN